MKLIATLGFFLMTVAVLPVAHGQDDLPPEPKPTPEKVLVNEKLVERAEQFEKSALKIKSEDDGRTFHAISNQSYAPKSQFVYFRRRGTRLQMIAMGYVDGERKNPSDGSTELVITIDKDTIIKYPQTGDLAVSLADPLASALGEKRDESNTPVIEEKPKREKPEPGYIEGALGLMVGKLSSDANPQAGGGKNSASYRFQNLHAEYFSGILPIGVSYDSHSGNLPTAPYVGGVIKSQEAVSQLNFYYRFKPLMNKRLSLAAKAFTLTDNLTTDNTGSELFTTKISAIGAGIRAQYRFASDVWQPAANRIVAFQPLNVFTELGFSPIVNARDLEPSRGTTSSGSTLLEYRLGATALFWMRFVPLFKRWVVQASYGARNYSLNFQGPTISEAGNVAVPEGIKTSESEKDYRFFIGFRINDPLEALFEDKDDKKGEKK